MADSIKEQILKNWLTMLQTITVGNGYNNTIGTVARFTLLPMDQQENIMIEAKMGGDGPREEALNLEGRTLTIENTISIRHDTADDSKPSDEIFNSVAQDLYRAALLDATRGGLALDTILGEIGPVTLEEGATQGTQQVDFEIPYRHQLGDMSAA